MSAIPTATRYQIVPWAVLLSQSLNLLVQAGDGKLDPVSAGGQPEEFARRAASQSPGLRPPPPTAEECPACASVSSECDRGCAAQQLPDFVGYYFDFTYSHNNNSCYEEITRDHNSVMADVDLYCWYPAAIYETNCANMHTVSFTGMSILAGCSTFDASENASSLVRESCVWACKHMRPFARCWWEFDRFNDYGMHDRIDECWLEEGCKDYRATMNVTCKPKENIIHVDDLSQYILSAEQASNKTKMALEWSQGNFTNLSEAHTVTMDGLILADKALKNTKVELEWYKGNYSNLLGTFWSNVREYMELDSTLSSTEQSLSIANSKNANRASKISRLNWYNKLLIATSVTLFVALIASCAYGRRQRAMLACSLEHQALIQVNGVCPPRFPPADHATATGSDIEAMVVMGRPIEESTATETAIVDGNPAAANMAAQTGKV